MYNYKAKIVRVVDGDTVDAIIDLGFKVQIKERLRLYGINTPETRTRDKEEKKRGLAAKAFVEKRILNREVFVDVSQGEGKFGRYLAIIYYNGTTNLNKELVEKGYAKSYFV
jgi:micrococcal nuclease